VSKWIKVLAVAGVAFFAAGELSGGAEALAATKPKKARAAKPKAGAASVKAAQQALAAQGYKITADGKMGPKTTKAIKSFQKKNGLKITGKLDAATKRTLGV
jgi:peptidoglycan hydrolase-like protein with peptidoglycan-binding domain